MDEEEKKENDYDVVTLSRGSNSTKTEDPYTTTTTKEDETTTKEERTISPFRRADGSIDQDAVDEHERVYGKPLAQAYGIDPKTGQFVGNVADLLGFDPEIKKKDEERKMQLARFKQKEAGWKNALGIITDIATAAHGGNVWTREKDGVAEKADADAEAARTNIQNIGAAVPKIKQAREQAYQKAAAEQLQKYLKDFSTKVSTQNKSGGGSTTEHSERKITEHSGGSYQQVIGDSGSNGKVSIGGKRYEAKTPVRVRRKDGTYNTFYANTIDAVSYARLAIGRCSEWLKAHYSEKDTEKYRSAYKSVEQALKDAGIVDPIKFDPNKNNVTTDDYIKFLQNGHVFTIDGIDTELAELYKQSTGKTLNLTIKKNGANYDPDGENKEITTEGGL